MVIIVFFAVTGHPKGLTIKFQSISIYPSAVPDKIIILLNDAINSIPRRAYVKSLKPIEGSPFGHVG
ncbi:MAG: hypothetical protein CSB47_02155 [Proteobacteria bacterium]|nr:MAG: hypothetical protein CSB47_02155 [Pseudomonadota bacterium]